MARRSGPALRRALCALPLLLGQAVDAMLAEGSSLVLANSATFLAKFCFTYSLPPKRRAGTLRVFVEAPELAPDQRMELLLFDDEADSYPGPSGEWDRLSCEEKKLRAKISEEVIPYEAAQPGGQLLRFSISERVRPRWWYIALTDCSNMTVNVKYKVHAMNDAYSWASEFSMDKRYALHALAPLAAVYLLLTAAQLLANRELAEQAGADSAAGKAAHPFARLLLAGLALGLVSSLLSIVYYARYAATGTGGMATHVTAHLLHVASNFVLASLLLLVSQGKCISYIMVADDARRMCRLLGPFLVSCFLLELWGDYANSRTYTTDYVYNTACGWAVVAVDLLLLGVYARNLRATHAAERDRGDGPFYRTWGVLYGAWFLSLPAAAALSRAVLAPYVWWHVSLVVTRAATAAVYAALVAGLWPGNTRTFFKLFASLENALENCVTPPNRRARQDRSPAAACGPSADRFAAAGAVPRPQQLPRLLGALNAFAEASSDLINSSCRRPKGSAKPSVRACKQ